MIGKTIAISKLSPELKFVTDSNCLEYLNGNIGEFNIKATHEVLTNLQIASHASFEYSSAPSRQAA